MSGNNVIDFNLLQTPIDTFTRPPLMPRGTYYGVITKHDFGQSTQKKTPYVEFTAQVTRAGDDIDAAELQGVNLSGRTFRQTFYLTPDAMWRLREFLESLGLDIKGRTINDVVPNTVNQDVIMYVDHEASEKNRKEDGSPEFYAKLKSMKGA